MDSNVEVISEKELEDLVEELYIEVLNEMLFEGEGDAKILFGPMKKRARRIKGSLKIVRKRKKALPLSLRKISKAAARRRGRKSAISRKGKQRRITKKAVKTTKKGRRMGLYKNK